MRKTEPHLQIFRYFFYLFLFESKKRDLLSNLQRISICVPTNQNNNYIDISRDEATKRWEIIQVMPFLLCVLLMLRFLINKLYTPIPLVRVLIVYLIFVNGSLVEH